MSNVPSISGPSIGCVAFPFDEIPLTLANPSRRALFLRMRGSTEPVMTPPWARPVFNRLCTRCDECVKRCEAGILKRGDGGYPQPDFNAGGCSFCADCADACDTGALFRHDGPPWKLKARIEGRCLSAIGVICRACGDACDQRAIRFRIRTGGRVQVDIVAELCNGCGFCYAFCPEGAIQLREMT
jgi:ferredoxin-type protein NapF